MNVPWPRCLVAFRSRTNPGYEEKERDTICRRLGVGREGKVKEHRKGVAWEVAEFIIQTEDIIFVSFRIHDSSQTIVSRLKP
jgi:hypothetical protein